MDDASVEQSYNRLVLRHRLYLGITIAVVGFTTEVLYNRYITAAALNRTAAKLRKKMALVS
jgi:hypothetical protein